MQAFAVTSSLALVLLAAGAAIGALIATLVKSSRGDDARAPRESIPSLRRSISKCEAELARVRRYDHPLSVMVVRASPHAVQELHSELFAGTSPNARDRHVERIVSLHVGALLNDCLRGSDFPMWDTEHDQYVVVLPESGMANAEQAAQRVRSLVPVHIGAVIEAGVAQFPDDGLAFEDLMAAAEERCHTGAPSAPVPMRVEREESVRLDMVGNDVVESDAMDRRAQSS